jgi:hypothetical protein
VLTSSPNPSASEGARQQNNTIPSSGKILRTMALHYSTGATTITQSSIEAQEVGTVEIWVSDALMRT